MRRSPKASRSEETGALPADQAPLRQAVVADRVAPHEVLVGVRVDDRGSPAGRGQTGDRGTDAGPGEPVDLQTGALELLQDTEVRESASAAAAEHQTEGPSGHARGERGELSGGRGLADGVHGGGSHCLLPRRTLRAGRGDRQDQVGAGRPLRQHGREAGAAGHQDEAIRGAQAERMPLRV